MPVLWTSFEYLLITFSSDGSAGSIAYSQTDFLPIIQIASITGITGISFLLLLVPSAIALSVHFQQNRVPIKKILVCTSIIIIISLTFGILRLGKDYRAPLIKVGLACIDEAEHEETGMPKTEVEFRVAKLYSEKIDKLASERAKVIVLPEKILALNNTIDSSVFRILQTSAIKNNVEIIGSYTRITNKIKENAGLIISAEGKLNTSYVKVNLFEGERYNGFISGKEICLVDINEVNAGFAICKDFDYQNFIRRYGKANVRIMFAPAWDFVQDGWLHSRMAVLRGVENGFPIVRCAREGRLTVSDPYGRIKFEASSENEKAVSLVAIVQPIKIKTLYSCIGDSFGIINLMAAIFLILLSLRKSSK